jgi:PPOX class probable F420-dependent enzyme
MKTELSSDVKEFLRQPNVAALATVRPDGRPHVTPVWYDFDGSEFIVGSLRSTQKVTNISRKGFASLSVFSQELPYYVAIAEGTARVGSPLDNVWRERVASRYLGGTAGRAYVQDTADWDVVALHIRPIKWSIQGFTEGE